MARTATPPRPRKTNAQLAQERRERELASTIALAKILRDDLADAICKMKDGGLHWENISKAIGLPGYCCMVVARETKANRPAPARR